MGAWSIQPSEFWAMAVAEWWWLCDVKRAQSTEGMTESGWAELYEFTFGDDD